MSFFNDFLNAVELPILRNMHDAIQCGFLDAVMPVISTFSKWGLGWIILALVLLIPRKTRRVGITMLISLLLSVLVCNVTLKPVVARLRPYVVDPSIKLLLSPEKEFSFPSGHTSASFSAAFAIFFLNKKWGIPAVILAVLIGFSRLYLMMHYPTDVIVSAVLGTLCALAAFYICRLVLKKTELPG